MSDKPIVSVSAEQPDAVINIKVSGDLPDGGVDGQVLTRRGGHNVWADPPAGGGAPSEPGEDGGFYVPHVDADGNLSWTASGEDMPSVDSVNIKGAKGDKGDPGAPGKDGVDATPYTLPTASADVKGGVMIGEGLRMDGEKVRVVPEGEYELIETITLEEEIVLITRTQEPNGDEYDFQKMYIQVLTPRAQTNAIAYITANSYITLAPMINAINTYEQGGIGQALIEVKNGMLDGYGIGAKNASTSAQLYRYCFMRTTPEGHKSIFDMSIRSTDNMPIGTIIKIWGVRANA